MGLESCSLVWSSPYYYKVKREVCTDGNKHINKVLLDSLFDYPIGWSEPSVSKILIPMQLLTFNNNGDKE